MTNGPMFPFAEPTDDETEDVLKLVWAEKKRVKKSRRNSIL